MSAAARQTLNTRHLGERGENEVCKRLEADGFEIVDRNIHLKFAEIDIIAKEGKCLCFVEVRTREDVTLGHPLETISEKKKAAVRRAAEAYLCRRNININRTEMRFDVAYIIWSTKEYGLVRDAF